MMSKLDAADRKILEVLQRDCRAGLSFIADHSGLSVPSVQRRLKRLRASGVIEKEIAVVDPQSLDRLMTFVVLVELERESIHQIDEFRRRARKDPSVQQCYYVTGEADFVLVCICRDMSDFEELTHRLFFDDSNVRRFRTSVVMDRAKVGLDVPVDE